MRIAYLFAALPLTCLFAGNAFAQACTKPLALANELQMESSNGGPSSIPVKINGTDQKLTLATASASTQLSTDTIKSLNLETSRDEVTVADFSMGRLHGTNVKWPVSGGRGGRGDTGGGGNVFGQNYMRLYDVDVDFGSDKLRLFSQDHCPGAVMYWKAPGLVGVVPISTEDGRVVVPVIVNGKAIRAVIDTAARDSKTYSAVAERVLGVNTTGAKTFEATVVIGPLVLSHVNVNIAPDINADAGDGAQAQRARSSGLQAELAKPEVTIGMDTLRKLHLYFAFGENKLYATGTTDTLAVPAKTP